MLKSNNKRIYRNEGLDRLQSKDLAQILVVCRSDLGGVLTAKENIETLFTDKYFGRIFDTPFEEVLFKYYLFCLVKDSVLNSKTRKPTRREKNIAVFTCFAIVWEAIVSHRQLSKWYTSHKLDPDKLWFKNRYSRMFQETMKSLFVECWNKFLFESKKLETLRPSDFFNKSKKWNAFLLRRFVPQYRNKIIKSIQRILS